MNEGDGYEGGGQAMTTRAMAMATAAVTTWGMATVMRLAGDKEGNGKRGRGNSDGNECVCVCVFLASGSEMGSCKA